MTSTNQPKPDTTVGDREALRQAADAVRETAEATGVDLTENVRPTNENQQTESRPIFRTKPPYKPYFPKPPIFYQALGLAYERDEILMALLNYVKTALYTPEAHTDQTGLTALPFDLGTARQMLIDIEVVSAMLESALSHYCEDFPGMSIDEALAKRLGL